jgi:hypothetical protein
MSKSGVVKDVKEPYSYEPHKWGDLKGIGRAYCQHCGLVRLKNEFSEWAVKMGCNNKDHPQYKAMRKKSGPNHE